MAKKKTGDSTPKPARSKAAKAAKTTKKKSSARKTSTGKSKGSVTASVSGKSGSSKPRQRKPATAKSIDSIIKQFEKERVAQNTTLELTRKKIQQTADSIARFKLELAELYQQETATATAIETLDSRRDQEVGSLLTNLGINLENAAAASKKNTKEDLGTPLFPDDAAAEDAVEN